MLADSTAEDFIQQDGTILVDIVRALYGLPESAKRWNRHFTSVLIKETSPIVTIYVDDCLHTYKGAKMRTELYGTLARANLPTPTVQQLTYNLQISYFGMLIQQKKMIICHSLNPGTSFIY